MGCDGPLAATAADSRYFNPRIPYGMRPLEMFSRSRTCNFNPRIPYGMRLGRNSDYSWTDAFQSTHPVWDATCRTFGLELFSWHFNPRIPYGMRRGVSGVSSPLNGFQSTHPVWDATSVQCLRWHWIGISIHASRMGCDVRRVLRGTRPGISIHASRMGCDCENGHCIP